MKLRIEIEMDNAAFSEAPGLELHYILNRLATVAGQSPYRGDLEHAMGSNKEPRKIHDANGNTVGTARLIGRWLK